MSAQYFPFQPFPILNFFPDGNHGACPVVGIFKSIYVDNFNRGTPRAVIVAATEDSWAHTIVPRLMAAGADLDRVYRVDVVTVEGTDSALSLPGDLVALGVSCVTCRLP